MVKPIGEKPHLPKNEETANLKSRILLTTSEEISGSIYPRFVKGVANNVKYLKATDKKGVTAAVFGRRSVDVQTARAVRPSSTVSTILKKVGQQQPTKQSKKKHY